MNTSRILFATILLAASGAQAQQHIGAKYQSRDPHTCASRGAPAKGPISVAQAKQYFICDAEGESRSAVSDSTLHLVTGVSVQVGAGRPFMMGTDDTGDNT